MVIRKKRRITSRFLLYVAFNSYNFVCFIFPIFAYIIFFPEGSEDAWQYIFIILLLGSIPILVIGIIMGIVLSKMALGNKKIQNSNLKTQNDINECKKEIK